MFNREEIISNNNRIKSYSKEFDDFEFISKGTYYVFLILGVNRDNNFYSMEDLYN